MTFRKRFLPRLFEDGALSARLRLLQLVGKLLVPSYRFKWPQLDWWENEEFTRYLARFGESKGLNSDRKWMIYQILRLVAHVPGDTAECGVFRGATSYLICCANQDARAANKTHHLFDSFEGLSWPAPSDGTHWTKGDLKCEIGSVRGALSAFKNVDFHPGWIPERFREVENRTFSFVHIDVDLADPTRESLAFFYPRMEVGGIIVCDDYGLSTCPGATRVVDRFLAYKPEKMLTLPDGGGFLIRNAPTAEPASLNQMARVVG
jgi:O-methyltransferase